MWWEGSSTRTFRRNKYADYFVALDRNENGVLEREDFATYVAVIAAQLDAPSEASLDRLRGATDVFWRMLIEQLDADGNQAVDLGELTRAFGRAALDAEQRGEVPGWASELARATFEVLDVDGDGTVDLDEYAAYLTAIGSDADSAAAYATLTDGGVLGLPDIDRLYRQWLLAGTPDAPGNLLLTGRLPD